MGERLFKDALKKAFSKIIGGELPGDHRTDADVADAFVEFYEKDVVVTLKPTKDTVLPGATIVVKTGGTVGSGTAITADEYGVYTLHRGLYNYSVILQGYAVVTGVFEVDFADVEALAKTIVIPMSLLTFKVTYNLNGGSLDGSERDYVELEVPYGTLVGSAYGGGIPTYASHTWTAPFWVTTAEGDVDAAALPVVGDVIVYAYWVLT